jgi:hypothetical protein
VSGPDTPLPTFLIIGAQKSATRWLRMNLGLHPDVFVADRELSFFNGNRFDNGLDWYRSNFKGWDGEPVVGEATPGYMMWRHDPASIAARIDESLPGVRLVAILRNPVDRAYSAFIHHMLRGRIPTDAELLDWLRSTDPKRDRLAVISGGWYAASLAPYVERFGQRMKVVFNDDVSAEPRRVYTSVLEHIGARPVFFPAGLRRTRHRSKPPEESKYTDSSGYYRDLTPMEREEIYTYFHEDLSRLEALLNRDLGLWRP